MVPAAFEFILPWLSPVAAYSLASVLNPPQLDTWPFGAGSRLIIYGELRSPLDILWPVEVRSLPQPATVAACFCDALQRAGTDHWLILLHPDMLWGVGLLAQLAAGIQAHKTLFLTCLPVVRQEPVLAEGCPVVTAEIHRWCRQYVHPIQSACSWNSPDFAQEPRAVSFPGGHHTTTPWPLAIRNPHPTHPTDWGATYLNTYAVRGQAQMTLLTEVVGVHLMPETQNLPEVWPLPQSLRPRAVYQFLTGCSPLQVWFFAHTFAIPDGTTSGEKGGQTPWHWPEQLWRLQDLQRRGWFDVALAQGLAPPDTLQDPFLQQEWADSWLQTLYYAAKWDDVLVGIQPWKSWWLAKYWPGKERACEMVSSHPDWGWCASTEFQWVQGSETPSVAPPLPVVLSHITESCYEREIQMLLVGLAATVWISSAAKSAGCLPVLMAVCLGKTVRWY